jgi:tRNA pseudouridine55 synthase
MSYNGFLVINKPAGFTSHQVVAKLRKILQQRRIGHTGTLDPMATGVLVIAVGSSTKLISFLNEEKKIYQAKMILGITTDTQDITGSVLSAKPDISVKKEQIMRALISFTGEQEQMPPMYSAIKVKGEPLYKLARQGKEIARKNRKIMVFCLEPYRKLLPVYNFQDGIELYIECSRGTYIRTLCHEIGEYLGCGGCMGDLIRLASGPFTLDQALTLEEIEQAVADNSVTELMIPPSTALGDLSTVFLGQEQAYRISQGGRIYCDELDIQLRDDELIKGISADGHLVAILKYVDGPTSYLQPVRVLKPEPVVVG